MSRNILSLCACVVVVMFLAACTGSAGIRARSYVDRKVRVDQEMEGGNFGYVRGTPIPEDRSAYKKDRAIYVLEITKEVEDIESEEEIAPSTRITTDIPPRKKPQPPSWGKPITIPPLDTAVPVSATPKSTSFVDYEVQTNDTLQKISKKFYDSYSKWPRIFDVNKDVLKDPDRLQPGVVIRVPVE